LERNKKSIGKVFKVLIEGTSRRSEDYFQGRNSANKVVVFPRNKFKIGNYANVSIKDCTAATLLGEGITTNE
jgi:tRNA-2-methylthio-N6-dimethylallyladenosine synthase